MKPIPSSIPEPLPAEVIRAEVEPGRVRTITVPGEMVQVVEGRMRNVFWEAELEEVPGQPGLWREKKRTPRPFLKLSDDCPFLRTLGLQRRDVLTYAWAGWIPAWRPGLQTTLYDPGALMRHIRRTQIGPDGGLAAEFWRNPEHVRIYRDASQEAQSRGIVERAAYQSAFEPEQPDLFSTT